MTSAPSVLVVEDEWIIAEDYAASLRQAGYAVLGPVNSVRAGLDLVEQDRPDLAFLDINLGNELSFPIAEVLKDRDIPFVFISGYGEDILPPSLSGATLLPKPVTASTLCQTVARQLKKS